MHASLHSEYDRKCEYISMFPEKNTELKLLGPRHHRKWYYTCTLPMASYMVSGSNGVTVGEITYL